MRDPVVVTMSPPRFLRLDDKSRLLVEINNLGGPAGTYKVELITGEGLSTDAAETSVDLAAGGRTSLDLGLTGTRSATMSSSSSSPTRPAMRWSRN